MSNWQKLCKAINERLKHANCSFKTEKCFEHHLAEYLRYIFGWDFNEVQQQRSVQFGHEKHKRPDIVLLEGDKPVIVFELKAYGQPLAGEEIVQFQSYIKQLSTRFGILTNSVAFQLWYRYFDEDGNESLKPVLTLRYDKDNPDGIRLGELLTRENYSNAKLAQFCDDLVARKKEIEVPVSPYDKDNDFMTEQMSRDLDEKMVNMINLFTTHVNSIEDDQFATEVVEDDWKWVRDVLLDEVKLQSMTDKEYEELIREVPSHIKFLKHGFGAMKLYSSLKPDLLHDSHKTFIKAAHYLNTIPEDEKFNAVQELTNNPEYKIKGMGESFWSEVIRCKFSDIPLVNVKTVAFFNALGLNIGVSASEKARNVWYCYKRWQLFSDTKLDLYTLSRMEHFAKYDEPGRRFMREQFGTVVGDNTY